MTQRVLIVDDNATIRSLSRKVVQDIGFEAVEATDGQEGLEVAQAQKFQLILTDINMPRMSGIEMVTKIRALDDYKRIPILFITTESGKKIMQQGKEAGANGWLVKPFQREKLLDLLKKLVKV